MQGVRSSSLLSSTTIAMSNYPQENLLDKSLTPLEKWLYFVGFPTGHGAVDFPFGAMWLLAPAVATSFGMSPTQIGYLFTAMILGGGCAHIPAALIGETNRRRQLFPLTLFLVGVSYFLGSVSSYYFLFLAFMVIGAASAAAWHPVAMGTLAERMPTRKAFAFGVHFVGGSVAEVIAPISVGFFLMVTGWRQVMQGTLIPAFAVGLLFLRMKKYVQLPLHGSFGIHDIRPILRLMGSPASLAIFLALGFHSMAIIGLFTMIPLYLQSEWNLSSGLTGSLFSLMILCGAVGAPLLGVLADSRFQRKMIIFSLVGVMGSTIVIVFGREIAHLVVGIIIIGFLLLGLLPSMRALLLSIIGGRQTAVMGVVLAGGEIVGAFGSLLSGILGEFDLSLSILLVGVLAGFSAFLIWVLPRKEPEWLETTSKIIPS